MKKTVLVSLMSAALMVGPVSSYADKAAGLNGILSGGRLYAPLRTTGVYFGAKINWNQNTKTASLTQDGKTFNANVGDGVLLKDGTVYVQFKALSNFFYPNDHISWNKSTMTGTSEHMTVVARPLTDQQVYKITSNAISKKKEWIEYLSHKEESDYREQSSVDWVNSTTIEVVYTSDWQDGSFLKEQNINVVMTKKGDIWNLTSFKSSGEVMEPH
ncbi:stalk domain-containing protein [Paenibacillus glycanilyticus]|uniref:stalk domain-containing protein n=1 Tax=Paenibacillus glycanilyticus TaxID=126569 RepID=UPI00191020BF|nr:stalk domain-containing protein [Paenibacillus glycanilyticus]